MTCVWDRFECRVMKKSPGFRRQLLLLVAESGDWPFWVLFKRFWITASCSLICGLFVYIISFMMQFKELKIYLIEMKFRWHICVSIDTIRGLDSADWRQHNDSVQRTRVETECHIESAQTIVGRMKGATQVDYVRGQNTYVVHMLELGAQMNGKAFFHRWLALLSGCRQGTTKQKTIFFINKYNI